MEYQTIVIMGRPGSGKGTQAKLLSEKLGVHVVSLGDTFREMIKSETYVGKQLRATHEAGELAPVWFAEYIVMKELLALKPNEPMVFDSGCRIKPEAELFHEIHSWLERPYRIVHIAVSEQEIHDRLAKRLGLEGRADDASHSIQKRIEEFNEKTILSIDYFRLKGRLLEVDGEQSVADVQRQVLKVLTIE